MGSKKTPLLQMLRPVGGTLYTFPSAAEDVALNLASTTTGVAMSHYALLNIPELSINKCLCDSSTNAQNGNMALAMSLQNYMMNFETLLINQPDYNFQELSTVSEKAFWHWAMKIGIIDPDKFTNIENTSVYYESGRNDVSTLMDDTVVKCVGSIDAGNSLSTEFGIYNETYINIPTSYSAGPAYFQVENTNNYKLDHIYQANNTVHLEGRNGEIEYYSYTNAQDIPYFDDTSIGSYNTDDVFDGLTLVKNIQTIQQSIRKQYNDDSIIVGSYDDVNVDIDNHFNLDTEFQFNAILLYYSVYDQDDIVKTSYATNLFGIIFLDGTKMNDSLENDAFYLPALTKRKSTTTNFGNSFSFRVNLKNMSVYDNTDAIIQDNTTMSSIASVDFSDAISNLNRAIDIMNSNMQTTASIQNKYASILSYYDNLDTAINDISTSLNAYLKGARSSFVDTSVLYTNVICPNKGNENNNIKIMTRTPEQNNINEITYTQPLVEINENGVIIPTIDSSLLTSSVQYIKEINTTDRDKHILNVDNIAEFVDIDIVNKTIDKMFNTYIDVIIKLKDNDAYTTSDGVNHKKIFNQLYIDANSNIFNEGNNMNVNYLKDENNNVNYIGFIPYLIAQVQKLSVELEAIIGNPAAVLNTLIPINVVNSDGQINTYKLYTAGSTIPEDAELIDFSYVDSDTGETRVYKVYGSKITTEIQ